MSLAEQLDDMVLRMMLNGQGFTPADDARWQRFKDALKNGNRGQQGPLVEAYNRIAEDAEKARRRYVEGRVGDIPEVRIYRKASIFRLAGKSRLPVINKIREDLGQYIFDCVGKGKEGAESLKRLALVIRECGSLGAPGRFKPRQLGLKETDGRKRGRHDLDVIFPNAMQRVLYEALSQGESLVTKEAIQRAIKALRNEFQQPEGGVNDETLDGQIAKHDLTHLIQHQTTSRKGKANQF